MKNVTEDCGLEQIVAAAPGKSGEWWERGIAKMRKKTDDENGERTV